KVDLLPIQEDFQIEIGDFIDEQTDVWHIGRFAVDSSINSFKVILLFKTLLTYAITPICKTQNSVMFAECDTKLFATLIRLQMDVKAIGKSMECLGSETVPIFGCSNGLFPFLRNNLIYTTSFSLNAS
ncbi:MAG: hypothetical protein LBU37_15855, partial [Tannerellaceae bacterium]|nr:hypothetical protein [Tannerellaceae bacterium]